MKKLAPPTAFSLIELLIVLAVVSVLSLLALSAMRGIRSKGDDTRCIANLRASGLGLLNYLNDHNGRFLPKRYWFQYSSYRASTNRGMREYFQVEADSNISDSLHAFDTILTCPTMLRTYPNLRNTAFRRGFTINYFLFRTYDEKEVTGFKTLQAIPNISAMWAFSDGAVSGGAYADGKAKSQATGLLGSTNNNTAYHQGDFIPYVHGGNVNHFFFLDGRVEGMTREGLRRFQNSRDFWGNTDLEE